MILGIDPGSQILGYALLQIKESRCKIIEMDVLYLKRTAEFDVIQMCWLSKHPSSVRTHSRC